MKSFKEFNQRSIKTASDWYGILKVKNPHKPEKKKAQ